MQELDMAKSWLLLAHLAPESPLSLMLLLVELIQTVLRYGLNHLINFMPFDPQLLFYFRVLSL